eukprot:1144287-Pelagomonas_calceolata.AAC.2
MARNNAALWVKMITTSSCREAAGELGWGELCQDEKKKSGEKVCICECPDSTARALGALPYVIVKPLFFTWHRTCRNPYLDEGALGKDTFNGKTLWRCIRELRLRQVGHLGWDCLSPVYGQQLHEGTLPRSDLHNPAGHCHSHQRV